MTLGAAIGGALLLGFAATYAVLNRHQTPQTEFAQTAQDSGQITLPTPQNKPVAASTKTSEVVTPAAATANVETTEASKTTPATNSTEAVEPAAAPASAPAANGGNDSLASVRQAAESGDPAAQTQLGLAYRNGKGVPQDLQEAVKWYTLAADKNYAEAQAYLGFMYMTGRGVRRNDVEAAKWHRKAAEQGNSLGQYNLGLMYMHGRGGVETSKPHAYVWLKAAAEQNNGSAQVQLATLNQQMSKAEQQEAQKLAGTIKPRKQP